MGISILTKKMFILKKPYRISKMFLEKIFFVYNGTGANILSLSAFTHSYNAVICAETAHINVDECGAIEKQSGGKLLTVPTFDGN